MVIFTEHLDVHKIIMPTFELNQDSCNMRCHIFWTQEEAKYIEDNDN